MKPVTLPDDPLTALAAIRDYLDTVRTGYDRGITDPGEGLIGHWQTTEWIDGLRDLARECNRIIQLHQSAKAQEPKQPCEHLSGYWINRNPNTERFCCYKCGFNIHISELEDGKPRDIQVWVGNGHNPPPDPKVYGRVPEPLPISPLNPDQLRERIFCGCYPCGFVYADRERERDGDYKRLAFLAYDTLKLELQPDCPPELKDWITKDAAVIQAKRGQPYHISGNSTITLGVTGRPDDVL